MPDPRKDEEVGGWLWYGEDDKYGVENCTGV